MAFSNISTPFVDPPCTFEEISVKEIPDGNIIRVSLVRRPYVSPNLPPYETYSVENCRAAGISLESVNPAVLDSSLSPDQVESAVDSIIGKPEPNETND